jgi:hypothetical protein
MLTRHQTHITAMIAALLATVSAAHPQETIDDLNFQLALQKAIQTCLSLPADRDIISATMIKAGWVEGEETDSQYDPAMLMIASSFFARQHSTDNSKTFSYSIANAIFTSGSILSNSDLAKKPQLRFQLEEVTLGFIGLEITPPDMPFCILGGPSELKDVLVDQIDFVMIRPNSTPQNEFGRFQEFLSAEIEGGSLVLAYFDQDKILEEVLELGPISSDVAPAGFDYVDLISRLFPVTLTITSSPQ